MFVHPRVYVRLCVAFPLFVSANLCLLRCLQSFVVVCVLVFAGVGVGVCVYVATVVVDVVLPVVAVVLVSFAPLSCRVLVIHFTVGVTVTPRPPLLSLYIRNLGCQQPKPSFIFLLVYRQQADFLGDFGCEKLRRTWDSVFRV